MLRFVINEKPQRKMWNSAEVRYCSDFEKCFTLKDFEKDFSPLEFLYFSSENLFYIKKWTKILQKRKKNLLKFLKNKI